MSESVSEKLGGWPNGTQVMNCKVTNESAYVLNNLSVVHKWNAIEAVSAQSLASLGTLNFQIWVGSGGSDDWSISFTSSKDNNETIYYAIDEQCDIYASDFQSGQPVSILINASNFIIQPPVSSSDTYTYETMSAPEGTISKAGATSK